MKDLEIKTYSGDVDGKNYVIKDLDTGRVLEVCYQGNVLSVDDKLPAKNLKLKRKTKKLRREVEYWKEQAEYLIDKMRLVTRFPFEAKEIADKAICEYNENEVKKDGGAYWQGKPHGD